FFGSRITNSGVGWDLTLQDGTVYSFGYDKPLVAIHDRSYDQVTVLRDSLGRVSEVTSPNGRWITFGYDSPNRINQATDQSGRSYPYPYDPPPAGVATASTVDGTQTLTTTYTWDSSKRVQSVKDARLNTFLTNVYDSNNRVTQQTLGDGGVW